MGTRSVVFLLFVALVVLTIFLGQSFLFDPAGGQVPWSSAVSSYLDSNHPPMQNVSGSPDGKPETQPATFSIFHELASTNYAEPSTLLSSTEQPPLTFGSPSSGSPGTSQTSIMTLTPEGICGHALDVPFGKNAKFLVHRVVSGENLTLYAGQYNTTTEAILAINYHLPMPVWEDWIIVIPVETVDVSDVPPFEPYQAIGTSISLGELARQLNTDPQSLYKYNAFEGACRIFSGWLLVPRKPLATE